MSYLVLARKYRPQSFDDLVGQEHIARTLANAIASGRVAHAFLFTGVRGVGKTTSARLLAKCLNCLGADGSATGPTSAPCQVCAACKEIAGGSDMDVQEIDGASYNGVDEVRRLQEGLAFRPARDRFKIYIVDEVHMLSNAAWNAFLKTLEEPPPHVKFIFATTEVHKVPVTILSRVQRYDFKLVPTSRITQHLESVLASEGFSVEKGALSLVARESGGSVRDSLSLLEQVLAMAAGKPLDEQAVAEALGVADRGLVADLGRAILARDAAGALALVAAACERAYDLKHLAEVLLEHLRNLVVARVVADPGALIEASVAELEALVQTARSAPDGLLELLFDRFIQVVEQAKESAMPRYVLEVGIIELCRAEPLEPVGLLVERLEQLEARLGGAGVHALPPSSSGGGGGGGRSSIQEAGRGARPAPAAPPPSRPPARAEAPVESAPAPAAAPQRREAPAAAPAPRSAPPPPDWAALAQALFSRNHRFAVFLNGEQVEYAPPRIAIAFQSEFDLTQARDRLDDARAIIREMFGFDAQIDVREGAGRGPSALAAEEQAARESIEQRRREAQTHPVRQIVQDVFGEVQFREPEVE